MIILRKKKKINYILIKDSILKALRDKVRSHKSEILTRSVLASPLKYREGPGLALGLGDKI